MEILGIGLPEMAFVLLIALILLGPKEMLQASRTIGRALRKFVTSPTWQAMRTTGKDVPGKTEGPAPVKQADSSSIPVPAPAKPAVSSPAEPPTPNNPQA